MCLNESEKSKKQGKGHFFGGGGFLAEDEIFRLTKSSEPGVDLNRSEQNSSWFVMKIKQCG